MNLKTSLTSRFVHLLCFFRALTNYYIILGRCIRIPHQWVSVFIQYLISMWSEMEKKKKLLKFQVMETLVILFLLDKFSYVHVGNC